MPTGSPHPPPGCGSATVPDQTVTRDRDRCTAHTRSPWDSRHRHGWWPAGSRRWAMGALVAVVVGVLVTGLVLFAVDARLKSEGAGAVMDAVSETAGRDEQRGGAVVVGSAPVAAAAVGEIG